MEKDAQKKDERPDAGETSAAADLPGSTPEDTITDAGASPRREDLVSERLETVRALAQRIKALRF